MQVLGFQGMTRGGVSRKSRAAVLAATVERARKAEGRRVAESRAAADYEAAGRALHANAERLRALRLARDAAQTEQASEVIVPKPAATPKR